MSFWLICFSIAKQENASLWRSKLCYASVDTVQKAHPATSTKDDVKRLEKTSATLSIEETFECLTLLQQAFFPKTKEINASGFYFVVKVLIDLITIMSDPKKHFLNMDINGSRNLAKFPRQKLECK